MTLVIQDSGTGLFYRRKSLARRLYGWTPDLNGARLYRDEQHANIEIWLSQVRGAGELRLLPGPRQAPQKKSTWLWQRW